MKSKSDAEKKQSKMAKILLPLIKILQKVTASVKCVEGCAGKARGYGGRGYYPVVVQSMKTSRSFSVNSSEDERITELLQAITKNREMELHEKRRCYSVDVGKLGRIDEDKPCSFQGDLLFPETKFALFREIMHTIPERN